MVVLCTGVMQRRGQYAAAQPKAGHRRAERDGQLRDVIGDIARAGLGFGEVTQPCSARGCALVLGDDSALLRGPHVYVADQVILEVLGEVFPGSTQVTVSRNLS